MTRQRLAQREPDRALDHFPRATHRAPFYRCALHQPWWFCTDGDCRFDLIGHDSLGTMYAGTDPVTGVLEVLGDELLGGTVSDDMLRKRTVWVLESDLGLSLADLCHPTALGFGVTNELSTMVPYSTPQAWATALADAGFDGIAYRTRFNPTARPTGLAVFGPAGARDLPARRHSAANDHDILQALSRFGITVAGPPHSQQLDIR